MSKIFVISDTHFNHSNILKFLGNDGTPFRKFDSVNDMNECMIYNWNSVVSPEDKVYHLGDVYFGSQQEADSILSRLNGSKRLVLGNHDNGKDSVLQKHFKKITMWRLFKEYNMLLSHVPIHRDSFRKVEYNVHGHIHEKNSYSKEYINVSVEKTNYTPINIEKILNNVRLRHPY